MPYDWTSAPVKANIATRPCLISASRIHCCEGMTPACSEPWMFSCSFEKPIGSQGPSPGIGSPAWTPPDMPLSDAAASAFNAVDAAGAAGATRPAAGAISARQTATRAIFS